MVSVRVMTYNIFRGGLRGRALDRLVRDVAPDVLLVNECPKGPVLWRRRCRELAERWEMSFVAGGRPAGSNALFTAGSVEVESVSARTLGTPLLKPRRGVVSAQLRVGESRLGFVGCHLSLGPRRRSHEIEAVIDAVGALRDPVVVAGDLNELPRGPSWARLREVGLIDHGTNDWLTYPAARPRKRIDALLVRGVTLVAHHGDPGVPARLQARASDHRAVLAVLEI